MPSPTWTASNLIATVALLSLGCGASSDRTGVGGSNQGEVSTGPAHLGQSGPAYLGQSRYLTRDDRFNDYRPTFSPDDRKVVFERNSLGPQRPIKLATSNGGEERP